MTKKKEMSDLVNDGIKNLSTAKTYVIKWKVKIGQAILCGEVRIRSNDSKAKVQNRSRGMVLNTLGAAGVSNIDTETFEATVTDAE
ncbi:unnamed protein product [marine sediment metagenome]|uniref:Uncharacterized protein n=1 Tax=marine sediment metagenome TaxID=412755 RepID=X0SGN0_9ZZZZ